jgi:hypothetical protein
MYRAMSQIISKLFMLIYVTLIATVVAPLALGYTIYMVFKPTYLLLFFVLTAFAWIIRTYVLCRLIDVDVDEVAIVDQRGGHRRALFHGFYRLNIGDRFIRAYSLRTRPAHSNEEALISSDGSSIRVRSSFRYLISEPVAYHRRGRKNERRLAAIVREPLVKELSRLSLNDLWNCPGDANRAICENLNRKLAADGITFSEFQLEEIILPAKSIRWRRNTFGSSSGRGYWQETPFA